MDLLCPSCEEPYESYHMLHDEAQMWNITKPQREKFLTSGRFSGPDDPVLKAAQDCGWKFATNSVLSCIRCPACNNPANRNTLLADAYGFHRYLSGQENQARERRAAVKTLAELLDGDDDALAVELADLA